MTYILDTDHVTILTADVEPAGSGLFRRMDQHADDVVATTIISFQEQMRGWLALLNRPDSTDRIVSRYRQLGNSREAFCDMQVLPFEAEAQRQYETLKPTLRRLGPLDLRIACIALTHDAVLLTRNTRDFQQVPGLKIEDWTQE